MAVKKGSLDQFLNVNSMYSDNNKHLRSIFIDKDDEHKIVPDNFLESSIKSASQQSKIALEHNRDTIVTQKSVLLHSAIAEKSDNEPTIGTQQEHKKNTYGTHQEHIRNTTRTPVEHNKNNWNTIGTQIEHTKGHTQEHNKNTIGTHKEHIKSANYGLSYLAGIQKQIILLFYNSCKKNRSHVTEEFSLETIANVLNIKIGSVKTSLRRLEEKGFIKGIRFKKGRGGWTQFELLDETYRELLETEKEHNWNTIGTQQGHKQDTYRNTEKDTRASSSSSDNTTTTTADLIDDWDFDISPYAHFGFGITQLKQLISIRTIQAADVEQSLIEFNYDFENNTLPKIKTNKINFLMGLLRSGNTYVSENYRNEQEQIIKLMAERALQKRRAQLEERFIAWEHQLTSAQREELMMKMPTHLIVLYKTNGLNQNDVKKWAMDYYIQRFT